MRLILMLLRFFIGLMGREGLSRGRASWLSC